MIQVKIQTFSQVIPRLVIFFCRLSFSLSSFCIWTSSSSARSPFSFITSSSLPVYERLRFWHNTKLIQQKKQNSTKCQENPWCHSRSCFLSNSILFSLAVVSQMDSWRTRFSFSTSLTRASAPTWQRWRRDDTVWLRCLFSCSRSLCCRTDRKSVKCRPWQTDQIKNYIWTAIYFQTIPF